MSVHEAFANIFYHDDRYKVSLPWKEFHEPLPDNYSLSVKRLRGLLRQLSQDPEILKEYDCSIRQQLSDGIVETVNMREPCTNPIHYLLHHAVICQDKPTTKLCIVYNASAKSNGPSLNESC